MLAAVLLDVSSVTQEHAWGHFLLKEIHSPASFNSLNKSSTDREGLIFSCHVTTCSHVKKKERKEKVINM